MTQDDVLFGYRLQLFDLAARTTVAHACRTFGVHRSTFYAWKRQVDRQGLEMLRPRERRRPVMPNQLSPIVEQRIVAFALGHPGLGPRRMSAELAREKWGGIRIAEHGVWRVLVRVWVEHALEAAGLDRPPPGPLRAQAAAARAGAHIEAHDPGEKVQFDCFCVG